jgi:3-oxocholest-4-en-26-oyl-CoA dehydrogenase alpha subunit
MDFSLIELTSEQEAFRDELTTFLDRELTPAVYERQRREWDNFDEDFHRAMAAKGWVMPRHPVEEGGAALDPVCARMLDLELERREAPRAVLPMLSLIWPALERYGSPELVEELRPKIADGSVRLCLGYTEPDGGSDIAAARVRAVRDGEDWVISGAKTFTSNAQSAQYAFLITRTDPDAPKHKGLTMFLAPLDLPSVDVQPMRMLGKTTTTTVYFSDARISDRFRVGEVNHGWAVLHGPLDAEHAVGISMSGVEDLSVGPAYLRFLHRALAAAVDWGHRAQPSLAEDEMFLAAIGGIALEMEAAVCTPGPAGRVKCSDVAVTGSQDLIGLIGSEGILAEGADGALGNGAIDLAHQAAQATAIYGGTTEVFRAMIAEHFLGLPRPDYPGRKVFLARGRASIAAAS